MTHWSYSSLTTFENCPRQYYKTRVTNEVQDRGSEATAWGTLVHGYFEERLKQGTRLPPEVAHFEPLVAQIADSSGELLVEYEMALDAKMQPVPFDSPDYWCRGIADVVLIVGKRAGICDWKSGKVRSDSRQLALMAAMVFAHWPDVERCSTAFVWLKHDRVTMEEFRRENLADIWGEFLPRVRQLDAAFAKDRWLPRPSGLCGWCPCTKGQCEFAK